MIFWLLLYIFTIYALSFPSPNTHSFAFVLFIHSFLPTHSSALTAHAPASHPGRGSLLLGEHLEYILDLKVRVSIIYLDILTLPTLLCFSVIPKVSVFHVCVHT
jgi:hypothetical protein